MSLVHRFASGKGHLYSCFKGMFSTFAKLGSGEAATIRLSSLITSLGVGAGAGSRMNQICVVLVDNCCPLVQCIILSKVEHDAGTGPVHRHSGPAVY